MADFVSGRRIAKLIFSKRRSKVFWNVFFSLILSLFLLFSSYFIFLTIDGEIEVGPAIAMFIMLFLAIAFSVFMLVIINIKNPSEGIKKIQKEFLITIHK